MVSNRRSHRGQTETIGFVLILSIVLISTLIIVVVGATGIDSSQRASQLKGAEHSMTQLDSRAAIVALGESDAQTVGLGNSGSGQFYADNDSGWMRITHHNYTDDASTENQVIFNESLGSVVYENGDTKIAYQGGGVWRAEDDGSVMISPPEFHYRSATLTLPVIRTNGSSGVAGPVDATVRVNEREKRIYPNSDSSYTEGGEPFHNPVTDGNVTVTVRSEYYQAWAEYFRTRTEGEVTVDHAKKTATVRLLTFGVVGHFQMPSEGNSIRINGLGAGHSINAFTVELYPDDEDAAKFNNLQWTLWAEEGSKQFEIHLRKGAEANDDGEACDKDWVSMTIYYSDKNGDPYHGWREDQAFKTECWDSDNDGTNESARLRANITSQTVDLEMQSLSDSDLDHFSTNGDTYKAQVTWDEHEEEVGWEPKTLNDSDSMSVYDLTSHYMNAMGDTMALTVEDKNSNTITEEASSGYLDHDPAGNIITFLHITENRIEVELD